MPRSFLVDNVRNLLRSLCQEQPSAIPGRLSTIGGRKIEALAEEVAYRTRLGNNLVRAYRGQGIAVMFHEIHEDVDAELRTGCHPTQLERVVQTLRADGRDIVTVVEGLRRLGDPDSRPFAILTFDDAYYDNLITALPVLERLDAPMTLFVPTGMVERSLYAWWLAMREVIRNSDRIDVEPMGRRFDCRDLASKLSAKRQITSWIGDDQSRADSLKPLFAAHRIDIPALVERYAMNRDDLRRMAAHPLVSIGAHSESHRFLSNVSDGELPAEFEGNKAYLEDLLDRPVTSFAYPYGTPGACGEREARSAAKAGFQASFTTRNGQLFPLHLQHPQLLPRIDVGYAPQRPASLASRLSGLHRAMETRLGDPVATLT